MNDIEKRFKDEVDKAFRADNIKDTIKNSVDFAQYSLKNTNSNGNRTLSVKKRTFLIALPLIAVLTLIAALSALLIRHDTPTPVDYPAFAIISFNPSIKLTIDANGLVTDQKGLNKDGVTLLYKNNLKGLSASEAGAQIIDLGVRYGYLKEDSVIRLNTVSANSTLAEEINSSIKNNMEKKLNGKKVVTPGSDDSLKAEAESRNIDVGTWQIIKALIDKGYKEEKLLKTDLEDLLELLDDADEDVYLNELNENIKAFINDGIEAADTLIDELKDIETTGDEPLSAEILGAIREFAEIYSEDLAEDIDEFTSEDVSDIVKSLKEYKKEMNEALKELKNEGDEAADILQDMVDSYKKWLNKKESPAK